MLRTVLIILLLVALTPALRSQECADTNTAPSTHPNTTDGLRCFLKNLQALAARGESNELAAAVKTTEIPNAAHWFHKTYPQSADSWIGPYQRELADNERLMLELLKRLATSNGDFLVRKVNDSPQPGRGMEWGMLQSMKKPVDIYFASWKDAQSDPSAKGEFVGYFMYIDGGFRWDSLIRVVKVLKIKPDTSADAPALDPTGAKGAFRVGGGVSAPKPIYSPDPQYSEEARDAKIEGTVVLWVIVGSDGLPGYIRVQKSIGHGLDERAIETVKTWRFQPALKDGQPVPVQISVEVNFKLR